MRQLDLFQDSPRTVALNMLREAILARNAPGAGIALERLLNLAPGHERASDAGTLIAAQEAPETDSPLPVGPLRVGLSATRSQAGRELSSKLTSPRLV